MKTTSIFRSKRNQLIVFGVVAVLMAGIVTWDFMSHSVSSEKTLEPRLKTVASPETSSVNWLNAEEDTSVESSVIKKAYEGYQRLRPVVPEIEPPEPKVTPTKAVPLDLDEEPVALIKFEFVADKTEEESDVEIPKLKRPVGTMLYARLLRPISSGQARDEQPIYAELMRPLILDYKTILPRETRLVGSLKGMRNGQASFSESWRVVINGEDHYALEGQLQESDYDPISGQYGAYDGISGLRMKPVDIDMQPQVHKLERLFEDVVRPLVVRKSQAEILRELDLPTIDNPWDIDGFEEAEERSNGSYYLPSGTEFYIQVF